MMGGDADASLAVAASARSMLLSGLVCVPASAFVMVVLFELLSLPPVLLFVVTWPAVDSVPPVSALAADVSV